MIFIAIPAYNEEKNIGLLLERIMALGNSSMEYQVLVINDGSSDNTVKIAESFKDTMPITVISHETNHGVGQVFRTIFKAVLEMAGPRDIVITMEADNTSDLSILREMIKKIEQGDDIVLASCYAEDGGIEGSNFYRIVLSEVANLLLRLFYPIGIKTYSSFYRAYRIETLRTAHAAYNGKLIEEDGFVCMVEVLVKFSRLPMRIDEVPMVLKMDARRDNSKMRVLRTIQGYLRFIARDHLFRQQSRPSPAVAFKPAPRQLDS